MKTGDPAGAPAANEGVEYLSIRIGAQDFALDIMQVREIRGPSTPLPRARAHIRGMINLRGVVMPIG